MPVGILGTIGGSIIVFTRTISDYILKKKMIDKGYVNEDTQAIFKRNTDESPYSSLKWGLIVFFAGLSLILMEYTGYDEERDLDVFVMKLVDELPAQYRVVLTLYHVDGMSYPEIEAVTKMPEGTVKSYLFRARNLLKEKVKAYLGKEELL